MHDVSAPKYLHLNYFALVSLNFLRAWGILRKRLGEIKQSLRKRESIGNFKRHNKSLSGKTRPLQSTYIRKVGMYSA